MTCIVMKQTVFTCLSKEETLLFKSVNLDLIIKVRFLRQLTGQKQQLFTELQNDNDNKSDKKWNTAKKNFRTFFGNYFVVNSIMDDRQMPLCCLVEGRGMMMYLQIDWHMI